MHLFSLVSLIYLFVSDGGEDGMREAGEFLWLLLLIRISVASNGHHDDEGPTVVCVFVPAQSPLKNSTNPNKCHRD